MATTRNIFINLPVRDLPASMAFWRALGFDFNPQFTDENAACLVLGENIYAMLLTHGFFQQFVVLPIADAQQSTQVLLAMDQPSREAVASLVQKATAHGGRTFRPAQDHGWMYQEAFADPDGHIWEVLWMDPAGPPAA